MVIFTEGCSLWYSCAAARRVESTHTVSAPPLRAPPPKAVTAARASAPPAASSPARLRPLPDLFARTARTSALMNDSTALWRPPAGGPGGGTSKIGRAYLGARSRAPGRSATAVGLWTPQTRRLLWSLMRTAGAGPSQEYEHSYF